MNSMLIEGDRSSALKFSGLGSGSGTLSGKLPKILRSNWPDRHGYVSQRHWALPLLAT